MKIRKNGKVITLSESDLRRITKRYLNESAGLPTEEDVINCVIENTSITELSTIPESCIKMLSGGNVLMKPKHAYDCSEEMPENDYIKIADASIKIADCIYDKMGGGSYRPKLPGYGGDMF